MSGIINTILHCRWDLCCYW